MDPFSRHGESAPALSHSPQESTEERERNIGMRDRAYSSPAMQEKPKRGPRSGLPLARFRKYPSNRTQKLAAKKIHVVPNISLDSCEHFGNDDLVIALRTTVATSVIDDRAVAVGQLELPYGN